LIKVAVIGVGTMGRNHARVYHEMPGTTLVAVADPAAQAVGRVTERLACRGYVDPVEMLEREKPDAVTVAVPTHAHSGVVLNALEAGCHVLVEKPIAATLEQADELIRAAASARRVLMVGHIERFNPAVIDLKRRIADGQLGRLFQCHARRLGPFPPRIRDVGVVVDLATHDLDLMRYLTGSEAVRVYAETKREIHTSQEDLVSGLVRFEDGVLGVLEINWLTPTKIREMTVTGERGMFRADYLTQDLYFFENAELGHEGWEQLAMIRGVSEGPTLHYALQKREPLRNELEVFLAAAQGDASGIVTGEDGKEALRLALAMIDSGQRGQAVELRH
jgi:UDP-N-acetylglucosamine 3-dehydrogenase